MFQESQNVTINLEDLNGSPPPYNHCQIDTRQKLQELIDRYEISELFSKKLDILASFKIVFIFDDSGSMNSVLSDSPLNRGLLKVTRWDELQEFAKISIDIANAFNAEGCDVYFLNRPGLIGVKNINNLRESFVNKPSGYTPLTKVLKTVLANANNLDEKKSLLVIIVTDGEPTNDQGHVDIDGFKQCLKNRNAKTFTTIVSCTDDDHTMEYLNNWDRKIPRLDVIDDFRNEKLEILGAQGSNFKFSFGDYIVKSLIGSIDPEMDGLDEAYCCFCLNPWLVAYIILVLCWCLFFFLKWIGHKRKYQ